jgi:hypothetical protein
LKYCVFLGRTRCHRHIAERQRLHCHPPTIGNGVAGRNRPDAAAAIKTSDAWLGWTAFYNSTAAARFFAKIGDGSYCRID